MSSKYEIEIKSLLASKENAERLKQKLVEKYPHIKLAHTSKQLNHYFTGGNISVLSQKFLPLVGEDKKQSFIKITSEGRNFSVRTRQTENIVLLVLKASIDDTTSDNGISRMEWEGSIGTLSLDELDQMLLSSGFSYQAKWSREREEYKDGNLAVCIDKNAGYGYVAEFEKMVDDPAHAETSKQELLSLMNELGVDELPQDRLARMFDFYNTHWSEYYGTENTFTIN